jgi:hypothetical protein
MANQKGQKERKWGSEACGTFSSIGLSLHTSHIVVLKGIDDSTNSTFNE